MAELSMPSILRGIFGIPTAGAHMTMYTRRDGQTYIWVAKRSQDVTFPGKLDQLVAGALAPGDAKQPLNTMKREAMEEAGLMVDTNTRKVTADGKAVGEIQSLGKYSFYHQKDESAGTEAGHLEPGIRFNYKLEVPADFTPTVCEPQSIEGFYCMSLDEIRLSLIRGEWKANSALAMIHFLVEDGHISPNETGFKDLKAELQDKIPATFKLQEL
jgi:8-oxo-dGTP pyrophosphatase MutT (NUDIX family)